MFNKNLLAGALFFMSTTVGASAPANTSGTTVDGQALQLFVTLPIKPDHLDRFLATMHKEVAGARSETGNIAFDVFQDGDEPGTLYLFEHWVNEAALDAHTDRPYYKAIRAQEADDLAGSVLERELSEVTPSRVAKTTIEEPGHPVFSVLETTASTAPQLLALFSDVAEQVRALNGNRVFALYQDKGRPMTFLLIERWTDSALREAGLGTPVGCSFLSNLAELTASPLRPIALVDRSR